MTNNKDYKMERNLLEQYDNIALVERRITYLLGARLRNKDKIKQAIQKQDEIRNKRTSTQTWDSVSQIRKWREIR